MSLRLVLFLCALCTFAPFSDAAPRTRHRLYVPHLLQRTHLQPGCASWIELETLAHTRGTYIFEGHVNLIHGRDMAHQGLEGGAWASLYKKKGRYLEYGNEMFWAVPPGLTRKLNLKVNSNFFVITSGESAIRYFAPGYRLTFSTPHIWILKATAPIISPYRQKKNEALMAELTRLLQ